MEEYAFPTEGGGGLVGGRLSEATIAAALTRLGFHPESVEISLDHGVVTLSGSVVDAETAEKLILAAGNLRGVHAVRDQLTYPVQQSGLGSLLSSFATLPAASASLEATEQQVHGAVAEQAAFGPSGSVLHTVQEGESLPSICEQHYHDAHLSRRVLAANAPMLATEKEIRPGIVLRLPALGMLGGGH